MPQESASTRPCARPLQPRPPAKPTLCDKKPEMDNNTLLMLASRLCTEQSLTNTLLDDLLTIQMRTMISPLALQLL
jgi:hypothetical protein